jgi:hypothetical protein
MENMLLRVAGALFFHDSKSAAQPLIGRVHHIVGEQPRETSVGHHHAMSQVITAPHKQSPNRVISGLAEHGAGATTPESSRVILS